MVRPDRIEEAERYGYPSVEEQLAEKKESRSQCDMCLGYSARLVSVCEDCQDKAAKFDITESERKELGKAIQEAIPILDKLVAPSYPVGEVIGMLRAALKNCGFKEGE